jgi:choline dehydrogenase-like flavoprotein
VTAMILEIDPSIITLEDLRADPVLAAAADKEYALKQSGPRTAVPCSVSYLPFTQFVDRRDLKEHSLKLLAHSKKTAERSTPRDAILVDRLSSSKNLGQIEYNFDVSNYSPYFKSVPGKKYATMLQMLQYPFSKGSIHIPAMRDGKPVTMENKPVIDPKYYEGPGGEVDFEMMVRSQEFADKICATKPLADIIVGRVYPPASSQDADNNLEFDFSDWVRESTITDWHPVGTCSMGGKEGIEGGVVDDRLRVYGVRGLRVCDASIMPLHIASHPQATIYAIGEKGASLILEDWEKVRS